MEPQGQTINKTDSQPKVTTALENGQIQQVIGPVVDVTFSGGELPAIYTALKISNPSINDQKWNLVVEVSQHVGENTVRCIAMDSTEGLVRGMEVLNTGEPHQHASW